MKTRLIDMTGSAADSDRLKCVGDALKNGSLAAIPTETVYGLAANAFDEQAVKKIFEVKGRPQDNPLIVHISALDEIYPLVSELPDDALVLSNAFWPGPMTIVLKRSPLIPAVVSAGLDTVAIRMPSHPVARAVIKAAGVPLAAPSANLSGSPSPTTAAHCVHDLDGKIPFIVDGGECSVGLESTVISLAFGTPVLLRPGGITPSQLEGVLKKPVALDSAVKGKFTGSKASAPGMKYKHYSPKAEVILIKASSADFTGYVNTRAAKGIYAMCFDEDCKALSVPYISLGKSENDASQAHTLFAALRKFDELGAATVYAHCPFEQGIGLAVYNRLVRSAGFNIVDLR